MATSDDLIPDEPARFIVECVRARRVYWTYHVNMRLRERSLPRAWILGAVETYEIIERYPEDRYLPSYLVWARWGSMVIHIVFAVDVLDQNVRVVTAYRPDPRQWDAELKRRRVR